jgi:hypothetical protein
LGAVNKGTRYIVRDEIGVNISVEFFSPAPAGGCGRPGLHEPGGEYGERFRRPSYRGPVREAFIKAIAD